MQHNKVTREQDEMVCADCGKRWDVGEVEPECAPAWRVCGHDGTHTTLRCHTAHEAAERIRRRGVKVAMVVPA